VKEHRISKGNPLQCKRLNEIFWLHIEKSSISISDMAKLVGYMVTWTTYGTWLQGDKRGYVKNGKEFDSNKTLLDANRKAISGQRVKLGTGDKEAVRRAILNEAQQMKQKVYAILVWSSHVHIVAENTNEGVGKVVGRYKAAATKALREMGFEGKVWTKGFDKRFCFSERDLGTKVDYVNRHGKRQAEVLVQGREGTADIER